MCCIFYHCNDLASISLICGASMAHRCDYIDLHDELVPYGKAWALQKAIVKEKKVLIEENVECPDTVIVLQHLPVYTLGTGSSEMFLKFDVNNPPYDIFRTERGGEVTYHGPGQVPYLVYQDCISFMVLIACWISKFADNML